MLKKRWLKTMIGILAISLITTGCALHKRSKAAEKAHTELIGLTRVEILSCAGVPVRSEKMDDLEFLTYAGGGDSRGIFRRINYYCEVTFVLRNNVVEKITYGGNTGGHFFKDEQCAYIVAPCLKDE
jgi:hypothetical protein